MAPPAPSEVWDAMKQAIASYTGLTPAAFFTVVAVAAALYHFLSGFLAPPPPPPPRRREAETEEEPLPPPVQLGEVTEEELRAYDGSDPKKPLLMAIKGQIYDVSQSRMFYGPGGPYALFAGRDASRALAKMSFEPQDLTGDISGLSPYELESLNEWEYKFMSKYIKVGTLRNPEHRTEADTTAPSGLATHQPEDSEGVEASKDVSEVTSAEYAPRSLGSEWVEVENGLDSQAEDHRAQVEAPTEGMPGESHFKHAKEEVRGPDEPPSGQLGLGDTEKASEELDEIVGGNSVSLIDLAQEATMATVADEEKHAVIDSREVHAE